jgi:hypothetical protein
MTNVNRAVTARRHGADSRRVSWLPALRTRSPNPSLTDLAHLDGTIILKSSFVKVLHASRRSDSDPRAGGKKSKIFLHVLGGGGAKKARVLADIEVAVNRYDWSDFCLDPIINV